jgi:hypothetical protein
VGSGDAASISDEIPTEVPEEHETEENENENEHDILARQVAINVAKKQPKQAAIAWEIAPPRATRKVAAQSPPTGSPPTKVIG